MNRAVVDLAIVSALIGATSDPNLAGFVFGLGAVIIVCREIAKLG